MVLLFTHFFTNVKRTSPQEGPAGGVQKKAVVVGTDRSSHVIAHEDFLVEQDSDIGDLEPLWAWKGMRVLVFNKKF